MPVCSVAVGARPATEKSPETTWQVVHASVVGMWPVGFASPVKKDVPTWQAEQSPVAGWPASATAYVPALARGRVWNPVYWALAVSTLGAIG